MAKTAPDVSRAYELCVTAMLDKWSAERLVREAYEIWQVPTIVFDSTIALIAYAFPRPFSFQDWEDIAEFGQCPSPRIVDNMRDYQEVIYRNKAPTLITWGTCEQMPQTCCPILYKDFMYGYIGMAPEVKTQDITEQTQRYIDAIMDIEAILAKTLGFILNSLSSDDPFSPSQYVNQLLLRDDPEENIFKSYGSHFPGRYIFAIVSARQGTEAELQYILGHICRTQPKIIGCTDGSSNLFLLISGMDGDGALQTVRRHLRATVPQQSYYVSISDCFDNIRSLQAHKIQAIHAHTVGCALYPERLNQSFRALYFDILCFYYAAHYGCTAEVPGYIKSIASGDKNGGKRLMEILTSYINNAMRISAVAAQTKLHADTIKARLELISKFSGLDLNNYDVLQNLKLPLHMYWLFNNDGRPQNFSGEFLKDE